MNDKDKILIFSDESRRTKKEEGRGRFEALCAVSMRVDTLNSLDTKLKEHLNDSNIEELKFLDVRTYKPKLDCCKKFIDTAIEYASGELIRVDVIIWDLEDTRHKIKGRDDKENLVRMYFHLLRNVSEKWYIINCEFYPDENYYYDYQKIIDFLNSTKTPRKKPGLLMLFEQERINFKFVKVQPQNSKANPIIQLCDIFAGIGRFSREYCNEFSIWKRQKELKDSPSLFNDDDYKDNEVRKSHSNRFEIIEYLAEQCKKKGISISLNTNNYLKSYDKKLPINFWHYEPQGDFDKAPQKGIEVNHMREKEYKSTEEPEAK